MMERWSRGRRAQVGSESQGAAQIVESDGPDPRSSSPTFPDFDEELCQGLEEVGQELDRFAEEVSWLNEVEVENWKEQTQEDGPIESSAQNAQDCVILPSLSGDSNRLQERDLNQMNVHNASPGPPTPLTSCTGKKNDKACTNAKGKIGKSSLSTESIKDASEDEQLCELKALHSLRQKLFDKVKQFTKQKRNLFAQKCTLLSYMPENASKCGIILGKNEVLSKDIGKKINSLNSQIKCVKKKIQDIENSKTKNFPSEDTSQAVSMQNDNLNIFEPSLSDKQFQMMKSSCSAIESQQKEFISSLISEIRDSHGGVPLSCNSSHCNVQSSLAKKSVEYKSSKLTRPCIEVAKENIDYASGEVKERSKETANSGVSAKKNSDSNQPGNSCTHSQVKINVADEWMNQDATRSSCKKDLSTHWCRLCNVFFINTLGYVKHLESANHMDRIKGTDIKKMVKKLPGIDMDEQTEDTQGTQKSVGVEFLHSAKVLVCELCRVVMWDTEEAAQHPATPYHLSRYKEYVQKNTVTEMEFIRAKMAAFTEYCNGRIARQKGASANTEEKVGHNKDINSGAKKLAGDVCIVTDDSHLKTREDGKRKPDEQRRKNRNKNESEHFLVPKPKRQKQA